ncbi:MAG: hypothetical protein RBR26_10160 [Methanosarcina mazei]|jgi:hypothetical protein|nr:hypothetical protein [Methanosarcina mazei]
MKFYVSKCHDKLNGHVYSLEYVAPYICVNPYYNVTIGKGSKCKYMIDSGAFQDVGNESRLTYQEALNRQLKFEKKISKYKKADAIVSYDRLVDEQMGEAGQFKERVPMDIAKSYVEETIKAAEFLDGCRSKLGTRKLILSCQGVNADQYIQCLENILNVSKEGDIIGFGGFCIMSKSIEYEKQYYDVIKRAFPLIKKEGINRVHIFGVGIFRALIQTDVFARMNGLECSYDTSSPEINATYGKVFNPMTPGLTSVYSKVHKKNGYTPADIALFNVKMINEFWKLHETIPLPDVFEPDLVPRKKKDVEELYRAALGKNVETDEEVNIPIDE